MAKDWIMTYPSGSKFYPLDPRPEDIHIEDIAHHLSNICRFTGGVSTFYSVAEHCCMVSDQVPAIYRLAGLLHDASEAYLSDIASPVKHTKDMAPYREAEDRLSKMILMKFGCATKLPRAVHYADARMLVTEALQLKSPLHPEWYFKVKPYNGLTLGLFPFTAKREFLKRFREYTEYKIGGASR